MTNLKCKSCGLVNPPNATDCKRCGSSLIAGEPRNASQTAPHDAGEKESKPEGCWGCIQWLIILAIAGAITGYLGIYIMGLLPSGLYPTILLILIFLPAAVVGLAAGIGVVYVINLFIPGIFTPEKKDEANKSD